MVKGPQNHHQLGVVREVRRLDGSGVLRKGTLWLFSLLGVGD